MLFFRGGNEGSDTPQDSAGLVIGANAIYVAEQAPSRTLSVALVRLEKPGFEAVHEDVAGDGVFDAVKDKPVLDAISALPMMIVTVSVDAIEPSAVDP